MVRLWILLKNYDLTINFAYRTFVWNNEAKHKAHVHVVIIGFSNKDFATDTKDIFTDNDSIITATTINPYLLDAPTVLIKSSSKPISSVEPMNYGSMPIDDGNLILSSEEKEHLLSNDPLLKKFIRPYYGGREILHSTPRYCLWLVGITPADLRSHPSIIKYIDATREFREASHRPGTLKAAERPAEFGEIRQPKSGQVIVLPKVSSERRKYIPIEYMDSKNIINGSALMIQNANLYMFGVLNSVVHNAWMRVVAGRMKSDYQYSAKIVYNNFPWPEIDNRQKDAIVKTAQGIISARKDDPDATLAELYDPKNFENIEISLRQAHEANDKAVLKAYGLKPSATEPEIVQHLFKMYEQLTSSK